MLPWTLLTIYLSTLALPASSWRTSMLWNELGLLVLAAIDRFVPSGFPLKRFSSAARTFLIMNVAALVAMKVFFVRPEKMWGAPTQVKTASNKQ